MRTVLLIDLSSVAHPLWHTSSTDPDPDATSTKTVARIRALASGQPHVAICCDSGRSFRRDISADYKAQRAAQPAALTHQIQTAMELLAGDGFPVWSVKGFEADDLIASAAAMALAAGLTDGDTQVLIASADKDLLQLVGPRVKVKRLTDGEVWDEATVVAKLGIRPDQMVDYLALVGDASDNVKGADKIGAKTAAQLLQKYGNLEDLFTDLKAHGSNFTPARATALAEFHPRMEQVRSLIRLRTDVALPLEEVFRDRVPVDDGVRFDDEPEQPSYDQLAGPKPMTTEKPDDQKPNPDSPTSQAPAPNVADVRPEAAGQEQAQGGKPSPPRETVAAPPNAAPAPAQQAVMRPAPRVAEAMVAPPADVATVGSFEQQLEPRNFSQVAWLADQMHKARLFSAYGTAQAVMSTILSGRELGLNAMASLRAFHIIEGRPTLAADLIRALVLRSGQADYFKCTERTNEAATFKTKRKGDDEEVVLRFTIEDGRTAFAKDDDAWKKSGWGKNPADMCVARAGAKLARLVYPDIVHGFYAPSEVSDYETT